MSCTGVRLGKTRVAARGWFVYRVYVAVMLSAVSTAGTVVLYHAGIL